MERLGHPNTTIGGSRCPDCGAAQLARTICNAIGQVDGVGLHTRLRVQMLQCERCDYAEFTSNWSVVKERGSRTTSAKAWEH